MGRLTYDELDNLYRLQMDENSVAVFNILVKSEIHEYSKVLAKNIILTIKDFIKKIQLDYEKGNRISGRYKKDLCFFNYDFKSYSFKIQYDRYYRSKGVENIELILVTRPGLSRRMSELGVIDRIIRKQNALINMINIKQIDNPKLHRQFVAYLKTILYLTIHNKLN